MSGIRDRAFSSENDVSPLEKARRQAAATLGIDLKEPQQERRIEALSKLYEKYSSQISICGFIYREIIDACNELIEIYITKRRQIQELVIDESFTVTKVRLENINHSFEGKIKELEDKILFNKQLLAAYETKYLNDHEIENRHRKQLKKLEDVCWDNWLKSLDVNKELRNTIIGFENRKALLKLSRAYIDYYIFVNSEVSKCFENLKKVKQDGIVEYYDILSRFQLPLDKKVDFKMFLQKKIESKLSDALEMKVLFGNYADTHRQNLDDSIKEIKSQYERDQKEIISIINHYKQFLIQKQVLFTNESESLVLYLKKRYVEKIDLFCSRFQMHNAEILATTRKIPEEDIQLLKKLISEEFDAQLVKLKIDYSKKFLPLLDNFWHLEEFIGKKYALDEELLTTKGSDIKKVKNLNLNYLIKRFDDEREKIKRFYDKKLDLIKDESVLNIANFDEILKELKEECDVVCCEVINLNARLWTKANAEFNCEARKLLIKLRHKYAPWITSWRAGSKSWMSDYLLINLNQELLKAVGEALVNFSPESELYLKASKALLYYNETTRKILAERDDIETEELLKLNTIPTVNNDMLLKESNEKLDTLKKHYENYWTYYNNFYNSLIERK